MALPGLIDDLIGEILLRLPPEDPECLVRASLVCKAWRCLLSDPGFPRRYRVFHGVPPLLGFLYNELLYPKNYTGPTFPRFVPVKEASPILNAPPPPQPDYYIFDCRHGRVLLLNCSNIGFIVWDPITNSRQDIGWPKIEDDYYYFRAAVLCALDGCDHLCCCGGPFLVVLIVVYFPDEDDGDNASVRTYSSETGAWSTVSSVYLGVCRMNMSSLLARGALYFILNEGQGILKYDLAGCVISVMRPPPLPVGNMVLMKAEGGGLGAFGLEGHNLHLWAWRNGIPEWEQERVIQLDIDQLFPNLYAFDFAQGDGSIFMRANNGIFAVELKSGRTRKIGMGGDFKDIFPFRSFCTPGTSLVPLV